MCSSEAFDKGRALGVSDQDHPNMGAALYCLLGLEPLVYLTKIIQACVLMCVGGRALGVSVQIGLSMCAAVYCELEAEPLVFLTKMIQACVLL